jgi:hypothetical protein
MKAILVLALVVLAANAVDGDAFYQGFTQKLGLTGNQIQDGRNCFDTVSQLVGQLNTILQGSESTEGGDGTNGGEGSMSAPNFEEIFTSLLGLYGSAQSSIQGECGPFISDLSSVLAPNSQNPSMQGLNEDVTIDEIVSINWNWYFPQIIQQFGKWVNQLNLAQDNEAGMTTAYILQILTGHAIPQATPEVSMVLGKSVPFDKNTFINQFFTAFFKTLGFKAADITTNVKGISTCVVDTIPKLITLVTNFQTQIARLSVLDAFFASKTFYANLISTFKNCKPAFTVLDTISQKIIKQTNDENGAYQIFLNSALNFPQLDSTIMQEYLLIDQGKYALAGETEAKRWQTIFKNVVNFAL